MPDDYYVSQYSGEEIDALLGGAGAGTVRYDTTQSLTDAQKTQARGNIAAAPAGYGYGESLKYREALSEDALNILLDEKLSEMLNREAVQIMFYRASPFNVGPIVGTLYKESDTAASFWGVALGRHVLVKGKVNSWSDMEWVNPLMMLGEEYRTTERYLGKPVYVKKVDFGNAPAGSTKEVSCATNVANMVAYNLTVWNGSFAQENTIISDDGTLVARPYSKLAEGTLSIALAVFKDISTRTVDLVVKYTKTTD